MQFVVTEECVRLGLRAVAIFFRSVRIGRASPQLRAEIAEAAEAVRQRFPTVAAIRAAPEVARFHEIHRQVGADPRKDSPSVEKLLAFALKRGDLPAINSLVDAYNLVSIRFACSLGAHDVDKIAFPVWLKLLAGDEIFTPLGQDNPQPVTAGEYGYVDGANRLLCRLDVVQAEFSKVTSETRQALVIVEGNTAVSAAALQQAVAEVSERVTRHCGGTADIVAPPGC